MAGCLKGVSDRPKHLCFIVYFFSQQETGSMMTLSLRQICRDKRGSTWKCCHLTLRQCNYGSALGASHVAQKISPNGKIFLDKNLSCFLRHKLRCRQCSVTPSSQVWSDGPSLSGGASILHTEVPWFSLLLVFKGLGKRWCERTLHKIMGSSSQSELG